LDTLSALRNDSFEMVDFVDSARRLDITALRDILSMLKYLIDAGLMRPVTSASGEVEGWLRCEPRPRLPRE
jgi:hypothetical protein